mmetsp:Transcript_81264/g.159505  ORF Transcript_81264/g.159505 Transcript_81264/m.159505 type:complete len:202 (+) Transcript_81264:2543-3148(+)
MSPHIYISLIPRIIASERCRQPALRSVKTVVGVLVLIFALVPQVGPEWTARGLYALPTVAQTPCVLLLIPVLASQGMVVPVAPPLCVSSTVTMEVVVLHQTPVGVHRDGSTQTVPLLCVLIPARMVVIAQLLGHARVLRNGLVLIVAHLSVDKLVTMVTVLHLIHVPALHSTLDLNAISLSAHKAISRPTDLTLRATYIHI